MRRYQIRQRYVRTAEKWRKERRHGRRSLREDLHRVSRSVSRDSKSGVPHSSEDLSRGQGVRRMRRLGKGLRLYVMHLRRDLLCISPYMPSPSL